MDPPLPDYTTWSTAALIDRVTALEAELRGRNSQHLSGSSRSDIPQPQTPTASQSMTHSIHTEPTTTTATTTTPTTTKTTPTETGTGTETSTTRTGKAEPKKQEQKQKQKKKPNEKIFDASRYHTRVIALKFAYLGGRYNGYEHHANNVTPLPTIEEEVWRALRKTRLIFPRFPASTITNERRRQQHGKSNEEEGERRGENRTNGARNLKEDEGEEEVCWDGVEYSKCGRTDRGVSAFGQVIGLRVRSARPKRRDEREQGKVAEQAGVGAEVGVVKGGDGAVHAENGADHRGAGIAGMTVAEAEDIAGVEGKKEMTAQVQWQPQEQPNDQSQSQQTDQTPEFDPIRDELPYIQMLNRVLPPDIRVLAWCPDPPPNFSARFNCRERRYRYFFTNPAYVPLPGCNKSLDGDRGGAWLDIDAMRRAAAKYEGLHDFRNLCKVDASKQITNFERRIFHAGIHEVKLDRDDRAPTSGNDMAASIAVPKLYYFEVRGSAFLWHQVRHLVAVLFLVGQGFEQASIVDELLDGVRNPAKPLYDMASDAPLVLWDCIFPDLPDSSSSGSGVGADHDDASLPGASGYHDALHWVYVGDEAGGRYQSKRLVTGVEDGKHGRNGVMEDLWSLWRKQKMHEILAWNLMSVVYGQGEQRQASDALPQLPGDTSDRVVDGSELPRTIGKYVPIMQRERMESPEVVNARYAARKGLQSRVGVQHAGDIDDGSVDP